MKWSELVRIVEMCYQIDDAVFGVQNSVGVPDSLEGLGRKGEELAQYCIWIYQRVNNLEPVYGFYDNYIFTEYGPTKEEFLRFHIRELYHKCRDAGSKDKRLVSALDFVASVDKLFGINRR
jgi:hypothetical protein